LRDEELVWCFQFRGSAMKVWVTTQVKFNVLPLMVKIQDLTLTGCA
jgi:hypothetical protein